MPMSPDEAAALRKSTSKLYHYTRVAFQAVVATVANRPPSDPELTKLVKALWKSSQLDDAFHELGSAGYQQLLKADWSPFKSDDDDQWWLPKVPNHD